MSAPDSQGKLWVTDEHHPEDSFCYAVSEVLFKQNSRYQKIEIVDTPAYGKALILDGNWQSCEADEFLYHEPLVHSAMILHGSPKRVAILGGGEGATLREVLRWKTVERAVMIDLDEEVVKACEEFLPEMHQGAFENNRAEVLIEDAMVWLDSTEERFDVVISDLSEPLEEGPAYQLFTKEYFKQVKRVLKPDGYFTIQAGSVAPHEITVFARVARTVSSVFDHVRPYSSFIPSFSTPWGFLLASAVDMRILPDSGEVDDILSEIVDPGLTMLDGEAFLGLMSPSAHIRRAIANETRVYTLADPPRV